MIKVGECPSKSMHNHLEVKSGVKCGCYFCLTIFDGGDVDEWTDESTTAICPRCNIDSVLAGVTDMDFLKSAHEEWCCKVGRKH